jgi:hypothetical protein
MWSRWIVRQWPELLADKQANSSKWSELFINPRWKSENEVNYSPTQYNLGEWNELFVDR